MNPLFAEMIERHTGLKPAPKAKEPKTYRWVWIRADVLDELLEENAILKQRLENLARTDAAMFPK